MLHRADVKVLLSAANNGRIREEIAGKLIRLIGRIICSWGDHYCLIFAQIGANFRRWRRWTDCVSTLSVTVSLLFWRNWRCMCVFKDAHGSTASWSQYAIRHLNVYHNSVRWTWLRGYTVSVVRSHRNRTGIWEKINFKAMTGELSAARRRPVLYNFCCSIRLTQ